MKQSTSCSTPASSIEDRYFDVFIEYAKASPDDILVKITACNRGRGSRQPPPPADAMVPQHLVLGENGSKPMLTSVQHSNSSVIHAHHRDPLFLESLDDYYLYCEGPVPLLFTDNETNQARLFGKANGGPYVKDGINDYVVQGQQDAVNTEKIGTKASPHYQLTLGPEATQVIRLRLTRTEPGSSGMRSGRFRCRDEPAAQGGG